MDDREKALAALAPRAERITIRGVAFVVRELDMAADVAALRDTEDSGWKLLVRSCFDEQGAAYFTDADIPALKKGSLSGARRLFEAAHRVNGELLEPEVKPSAGAPAGG